MVNTKLHVPLTPQKMDYTTRIALLDKDYNALGETTIENATWRLMENAFYLDEEITIEIMGKEMIYYCSVQCPRWANPVILPFRTNLPRLAPGVTVYFAHHDFSMTIDNGVSSPPPDTENEHE